jgi:ligand-binding sensor domain-containing protein
MSTVGLPSNTVRAIAHDSSGGTWVGTDWGLGHYDGSVWEFFQTGQSPLPENDVRALACDATGRLWIGMFTQGLMVKDGDTWTQFAPGASPMPADQVRNITFDAQENAWVATTSGLVRTDLNEWRIYNDTDTSYNNQSLGGVNIADVAVRDDGLVCVGTLNAGFTYLTDTSVLIYNSSNVFLPDNTALGVAIDSEGERWAACPSGGLLRFTGSYDNGLFFQFITDNSGIPTNALNDIVIDGVGRKIIATQSAGLAILSPNNVSWSTYNMENSGLPDNEVNCVTVAPDGAIWVGTAIGGAARFDPSSSMVEAVDGPGGLLAYPNPFSSAVHVLLPESHGQVSWSVYEAGGRLVEQGTQAHSGSLSLSLSQLLPGPYILTVALAHNTLITALFRQ